MSNPDKDLTPFSEVLRTMNAGAVNAEITTELAELVRQVKAHRKGGSLTVKFDVKADGQNDDWIVVTASKIATTLPQPDRRGQVFYGRHNGDLLRDDPEQGSLKLRRVGEDDVDTETGEVVT